MDELVKELMSATPIVSQISKRTGLSMEQLDQVVRITPCVVIDDDGDEMITFLASTTMCSKPGFMAEAYEFGIARLHSEYYINPEKAEKKVRLALEDEFKQLNWAATADAVCDTNVVLADKNNELAEKVGVLQVAVDNTDTIVRTAVKDARKEATQAARGARRNKSKQSHEIKQAQYNKLYEEESNRNSGINIRRRIAQRMCLSYSQIGVYERNRKKMLETVSDKHTNEGGA
ncbi:hypothetical protein F9362_00270 [Escherichia coli]|uniref:hypothetical protein n=1 Tax=Enterobacteriaceae TaxID=543 RepID=UPI000B7FBA84|nr:MULTISPECIES: hypothetical protein [Enterobacteriaceae]EFC1799473.1 hypothetical protein [Escherichia coli]EFH4044191.1 hypothetical protein [Escherichia coli]EHQ8968207.1 hypothetical protein [Escherichia coli]EIT4641250.1 hypothetical protein [Escherichia coli]MBN6372559.1 hypothetical protein [Escherichia coli]